MVLKTEKKEKFQNFGKYLIHIPSLKKNMLNIKFQSKARNNNIPLQLISSDLTELIQDILKHEKLDMRLYNKLPKDDKSFFDVICEKCELDELLGIKRDRTEEKTIIDRFNIIRGEIASGNNSQILRGELRTLLIKMIKLNLIPRNEANQIIIELISL